MIKMKSVLTIAFAGAVMTGCAKYDLNATSGLTPSGSEFNQALYKEYLALAVAEDDEGDITDAAFFDSKAIAAAAGETVTVQPLSERKLPENKIGELNVALKTLQSALDAGAADKAPADAARAQASFDCWLQELEENDQPEDIGACREHFEEALNMAFAALDVTPPPPPPAPAPKAESIEFVIFFDFDSANLNSSGLSTVAQVVMAADGKKSVLLSGHTDTSGSSAYNKALSERRVQAVAAKLKADGVPANKIVTQFFGEDVVRVKTGDGVKEFGNRRVTATIR